MKAIELRIGNYVDITKCTEDSIEEIMYYEKVTSVEQRFIGSQSSTGNLAEFINPIPLTEEWLLKFGFNKIHESETYDKIKVSYIDDEYAYWKPGLYLLSKNGDWWCFYRYTDEDTGFEIHSNVEYVHQLQNLYFALTGEELEIK